MTGTISKVFSKLVAIIVILMFVLVFREMILTDKDVSTAFGGLMGALPFAKQITDVVCKVMKYQDSVPAITANSLIADFLKLAVMASIQPPVIALLSRMFLRVPDGSYYEREEYMKGFGYRMKEMVITILSSPLLALLAAHLTTLISDYLTANFGAWLSGLLGVLSVAVMTLISTIPLCIAGLTVGAALVWRVAVTLLGKMATTMGTNVICLWIYLSIAGGLSSQTLAGVFSLIIWLVIMDIGMQMIKQAIVAN